MDIFIFKRGRLMFFFFVGWKGGKGKCRVKEKGLYYGILNGFFYFWKSRNGWV